MVDKEIYDELFDIVVGLDFDYEIQEIKYWADTNQWTVLVNNFNRLSLESIIGDLNVVISRCHDMSEFKFIDGYFDISEMESTQEFDNRIFENFENFLEMNELSTNLESMNKLNIRSFSLTFSF